MVVDKAPASYLSDSDFKSQLNIKWENCVVASLCRMITSAES